MKRPNDEHRTHNWTACRMSYAEKLGLNTHKEQAIVARTRHSQPCRIITIIVSSGFTINTLASIDSFLGLGHRRLESQAYRCPDSRTYHRQHHLHLQPKRAQAYHSYCHYPHNRTRYLDQNILSLHYHCYHHHHHHHHHHHQRPKHNITTAIANISSSYYHVSFILLLLLATTAARPVLRPAQPSPDKRPKCPEPLSPCKRRASEAVANPIANVLSVSLRLFYAHDAPLRKRDNNNSPASHRCQGKHPSTSYSESYPKVRHLFSPTTSPHAPEAVRAVSTVPTAPPTGEPVRRQVVTFSPPSNVSSSRHDATESKFFYASDAKGSSHPAPQPKPVVVAAPQQQRGSTFMYANGSAVERNRPSSPGLGFTPLLAPSLAPSLSPPLAPTPETQQSKFFYANGAPNLQPGFRPSSAASAVGSVHSDSRKLPRTSAGSAGGFPMAQRPLSPNKPMQPPTSAPLIKSNSQPNAATRLQMASPPPLAPVPHRRKVSSDAVSQAASYVSEAPPTDAMIMSRFMASQSPTPSEMPSPTVPSFFPNQPITIASIIQAADDLSESEDDEADESKDLEELHSPTKSTHGDPLNDMVVNARRERKVQDLEITNASLEAINRSLERQLRKQTAELRRYKRLSRSGRLSVPSAPPSRVPSETVTGGLGIENMDLSDLSEEEAENDTEDVEDSMFESSEFSETDSGSSKPDQANPDRDARRRKRDEKRLQLDLSKHRELLVDSQKINQSIKRCLNWTEELIKEGKKALEYNVRPSDVELPPRVLQPQYLFEDNEADSRKDDVSLPSSPLESPKSLTAQWSKEPQDRDSGIELPADGG
ncbi:hypothetical protein Cob_v009194 [Colletotrichum orbiculare MAFF 240422]|uniref:Uncharacterized protein n=1 Tax=Colletotrichum orbiculare (strain 104-T / ATCC 96160 / CBS 514.97 / LARS 414 / MAFF 240422) TaxID=1213857 RepID=A0A484FHP7_COLOR|nr:hypothetical protein Cob_v009194 [Colletotrichum orbiculare MAFF 240422]